MAHKKVIAALLATVASTAAAAASCTLHKVPITVENVQNRVIFAPDFDLDSVSGVTSFLSSLVGTLGQFAGFLPVGGTYNIAMRYCAPKEDPGCPTSRSTEVQLLLHGLPYNMSYWFGLPGNPAGSSPYDWVDYATSQGYSVLAIDNLGAGESDKPDPITMVQQPLQIAILHNIAQQLRSGSLGFAPAASEVIFVGHSVGSIEGNGIATQHPADFDAMILTGYSYTLVQAVIGLLFTVPVPAQVQNPAKFGNYAPGYLTFGSRNGKRQTYYASTGDFSAALAEWDFDHEDTTSVGQLITAFSGLEEAPEYTGDVLVLTGQEDALFCGDGSRDLGPQYCGSGSSSIPARSQAFFPAAKFAYHLAPNTSHATVLHYSAPESIQKAHEWLAASGY